MKVVESAILSTDLAVYFKKKNKFMELIDEGEFDWQSEEKKERKIKQLCIITIKKAIERSRRNIYVYNRFKIGQYKKSYEFKR